MNVRWLTGSLHHAQSGLRVMQSWHWVNCRQSVESKTKSNDSYHGMQYCKPHIPSFLGNKGTKWLHLLLICFSSCAINSKVSTITFFRPLLISYVRLICMVMAPPILLHSCSATTPQYYMLVMCYFDQIHCPILQITLPHLWVDVLLANLWLLGNHYYKSQCTQTSLYLVIQLCNWCIIWATNNHLVVRIPGCHK